MNTEILSIAALVLLAGCTLFGGPTETKTNLEDDTDSLISELDSLDPEFSELDSLLENISGDDIDAMFEEENLFTELI